MLRFDKRKIAKFLNWLKAIKTWQLVVLLLIGAVLSVSLLRLNNLGMVERREAVKQADQAGDMEQLKQSLVELQNYVSSHMNTSLGQNGFYLEHKYQRDKTEAALDAASNGTNPNADVYQEASVECRSRFQGGVESYRNDYVKCVADRVAALGSAEPLDDGSGPPPAAYQINYSSPVWSPDLAGISVMLCLIITGVIILRALATGVLRAMLRSRFKSV